MYFIITDALSAGSSTVMLRVMDYFAHGLHLKSWILACLGKWAERKKSATTRRARPLSGVFLNPPALLVAADLIPVKKGAWL